MRTPIRRRRRRAARALALACVCAAPVAADAANWIAGSGNWSTPSNWNTNAVPGPLEPVNIQHNDSLQRLITYNYSGPDIRLGSLTINQLGSGQTTLARGDATLDGKVSFPDLVALAQNYNTTDGSALWTKGDFNYDGNVTFPDLVMLAQNYNSSLPTAAPIPGVPAEFRQDLTKAFAIVSEPSLLAPVALLACGLTNRTRRHSKSLAARRGEPLPGKDVHDVA